MTKTLDYLRESPLTWIVVTLLAYQGGVRLRERTGGHPLAQPVLVAAGAVVVLLLVAGVDYETYWSGGSLIHALLGPATVALAVPLHQQAHHLREMLRPILVALPVGALVSIGSGMLLVRWLGGSESLELTIAPKSATTPVAIAVADSLGGVPAMVAVFTIVSGGPGWGGGCRCAGVVGFPTQ